MPDATRQSRTAASTAAKLLECKTRVVDQRAAVQKGEALVGRPWQLGIHAFKDSRCPGLAEQSVCLATDGNAAADESTSSGLPL